MSPGSCAWSDGDVVRSMDRHVGLTCKPDVCRCVVILTVVLQLESLVAKISDRRFITSSRHRNFSKGTEPVCTRIRVLSGFHCVSINPVNVSTVFACSFFSAITMFQ